MKKTNDAIKKMRAAHEKQAEAIRGKPCYDRVSEEVDKENSVISILETTAADGKNYQTKFYNLDAIISVG